MKAWKPLALGAAAVVLATATYVPLVHRTRGVRPLEPKHKPAPERFDREQSAALFVGVRSFIHDRNLEVPYAADDAVDLAYMFSFDPRIRLVVPRRVVLALSGRPQKKESRMRLKELEAAGALVRPAGPSDILTLLQQQAALAGRDGILIVSLATHGFTRDGVPYILGSSSLFHHPETALSAAKVFDIAAASVASRSLIFVDSCRERVVAGTRSGGTDRQAFAPLIRRMARVNGQVIFYAATAGNYAYDDPVSGNGVFTKGVIEGLNCNATSTRGIVTAENLSMYVERHVRTWIRMHRDPSVGAATEISMEGDTRNMPLSVCAPLPPMPGAPASVSWEGSIVTAWGRDGTRLWQHDAGGPVVRAEVVDLNADGEQEIIVGLTSGIMCLSERGERTWSIDEGMPLRTFVTADLFRKHTRQIVALWSGPQSSASKLSLIGAGGQRLAIYERPGPLANVAVDRPTTRHAPKIIVTAANDIFLLDPKKVAAGRPVWSGSIQPPSETIEKLEIIDHDNDRRRDIDITTAGGTEFFLDFEGKVIDSRSARDVRFLLDK